MQKFESIPTLKEWQAIGVKWRKPSRAPARHAASLTPEELKNKVICYYKHNASRHERDIGLVLPLTASSTPIPGTYFWISGINTLR